MEFTIENTGAASSSSLGASEIAKRLGDQLDRAMKDPSYDRTLSKELSDLRQKLERLLL